MPRRLLLAAGWTATTILAMIGPAACWVMITVFAGGHVSGPPGCHLRNERLTVKF
jgi:hypothetical protein